MNAEKKMEILKARKEREIERISEMVESGKAFPYKIGDIDCVWVCSDTKALKQFILGFDKPNPEGIPVAKLLGVHGKGCKPIKVRQTFYDGNIKAVPVAEDGTSLDEDDFDLGEDDFGIDEDE